MTKGKKRLSGVLQLRKQLGLNQSEFWGRLGISQSGGSRYEKENRSVPAPVRILLDVAYGKHPEKALKRLRSWK
jgi:transcriptional regulator with XRE-family HTH domain